MLGERMKLLDDAELNHQHERIANGTYAACEICGIELSGPSQRGTDQPALCAICAGRTSKS